MDDGLSGSSEHILRNRRWPRREKVVFFYHMNPPLNIKILGLFLQKMAFSSRIKS
jgi:hypothetical protein